MRNYDYLGKEEVATFTYNTSKENRLICTDVCYKGRPYTKWGEKQIVTFFGIKYKVTDLLTNKTTYIVHIGLSKQHPLDREHNVSVAIEHARVRALINPVIILNDVSKSFDKCDFDAIVSNYEAQMDLDFIKTKKEIEDIERRKLLDDWSDCLYMKLKLMSEKVRVK